MIAKIVASAAIALTTVAGGCDLNTPPPTAPHTAPATPPATATGAEQTVVMRITGYSKIDNTPAGSKEISMPVIHSEAGGTGAFDDPLTAASPGHAPNTETPRGTKFYLAHIHRYVIIEDSGATKTSLPHLDVYTGDADNALTCENKITGEFPVVVNPGPNHPVIAGPIAIGSGCDL